MPPEQHNGPGAENNGHGTDLERPSTDGNGNGYRTFSGAGFGTLMMQFAVGPRETPPVASTRAYLRNGLPSLYQDGDFGMRFIGSLEELLDPIVAILDALPYHFDPNFAPPDILNLLAAWLGVDLDETQDIKHQREMVRRSAELSRRRGTVKGLELALQLHFPNLPLRLEDNGGVIWHGKPAKEGNASSDFVVYCDKPVEAETQAAVARVIEQYKPVQATYRLRVKAAKKKVES
ncbi:phage tail protein [Solirubrobacter phytolaccae]|uniref:Phage tail protein n=1 Tax=Solirubrobacter phytolaccae TaxID=1404360 RepID=A0A9X3SCA2_9ACTN|nr:phage tail protein [Solirubrobacter phytolaccae]MDA0185598.1 phage tail protein [Solirubrobacter phytolaccae]